MSNYKTLENGLKGASKMKKRQREKVSKIIDCINVELVMGDLRL